MAFDIPFYTSNILYVGQFEETKRIIFLDATCPKSFEGNIVYVSDGDKLISKGCYEMIEGKLGIIWFETGLDEPAPKMELVKEPQKFKI